MDLDELRSVQSTERAQDSLQHLRDSFYDDVADYLRERIAQRDRRAEEADRPFADERVRQLTDEIETASEVLEAIYERRVGKVVKLASFAAADMPVEEEGMTDHERELYEDLVARIEANKAAVLDAVVEGRPAETPTTGATPDVLESMTPAEEVTIGDTTEDSAPRTEPPVEQSQPVGSSDPSGAPQGGDAGPDRRSESDAHGSESDVREDPPDGRDDPSRSDTDAVGSADGGATTETGRGDDAGDLLADAMRAESDGGTAIGPNSGDGLAAGPDSGEAVPGGPHPREGDSGATASTVPEASSEPSIASPVEANDSVVEEREFDRTLVRITEDIGEIFGVDEQVYPLERGDVVSLPKTNAEPIVDSGAAERLR